MVEGLVDIDPEQGLIDLESLTIDHRSLLAEVNPRSIEGRLASMTIFEDPHLLVEVKEHGRLKLTEHLVIDEYIPLALSTDCDEVLVLWFVIGHTTSGWTSEHLDAELSEASTFR